MVKFGKIDVFSYIPRRLQLSLPSWFFFAWESRLVAIVPLHLLAYQAAVLRGCDIDNPRNLARSATVE
jgi:hypothetical protein